MSPPILSPQGTCCLCVLGADFSTERIHFFHNKFLHALNRFFFLKTKIESLGLESVEPKRQNETHGFAKRFIGRIVPHLEVGMVEGLLTADPFRGIKAEHLGKKINGKWIGVREERREWYAGFYWQ